MNEMRKHGTFDKDVNTVIEYIRSSGGAVVTAKTVKELTGLNEVYANNVLKAIKADPRVDNWKYEENKKATFFRVKEDQVSVPEPVITPEPIAEPVVVADPVVLTEKTGSKTHKKYKSLTEKQVDYIEAVFAKKPLEQSAEMLMKIINAIANVGGIDHFVSNYVNRISYMLILRNNQIRLYADLLKKYGLLVSDGDSVKLLLNGEDPESVLESIQETVEDSITPEPVVTVKEESIVTTPEPEPVITPAVFVEPVQEAAPEVTIDAASEIGTTLINNMESFRHVIGQFQDFMGNMISQVNGTSNQSEIEELKTLLSDQDKENSDLKQERDLYKKQLEEGNKSLTRLILENSNLKEALTKKCDENRENRKIIAAHKEANDNVFAAMQEKFQILLADINNTITDYTRIPAWQVTSAHTARVQSQIINAVTSTMNSMIDSNCATIIDVE